MITYSFTELQKNTYYVDHETTKIMSNLAFKPQKKKKKKKLLPMIVGDLCEQFSRASDYLLQFSEH